jgi:hypothetical protein
MALGTPIENEVGTLETRTLPEQASFGYRLAIGTSLH